MYKTQPVAKDLKDFINREFVKRKTLNKKRSSYGIKHYVERRIGRRDKYVSNDELINAMIACGFNYELTHQDSPNYHFNVSERSFRPMTKEEAIKYSGNINSIKWIKDYVYILINLNSEPD